MFAALAVLSCLVAPGLAFGGPATGLYGIGDVVGIDGKTISMAEFQGNVTVVVNVATF